jgi:hypothetical protein
VRLSSRIAALGSLFAVETFEMGGICTDFGATLTLFPGRGAELRQSLQETGVMGVATNRTPTGDDRESLFLLREPFIFASRIFYLWFANLFESSA